MTSTAYPDASAAAIYDKLTSVREPYIRAAEEAAGVTVPGLFPIDGVTPGDRLKHPRNWIGPRGANHITSRIGMALFPAGSQFIRMIPDGVALKALEEDQTVRAEVEESLASIEREVQKTLATTNIRVDVTGALKQLVVSGNVVTYMHPDRDDLRYFTLRNFVVDRDLEDNLLVIVIRQDVDPSTLDALSRAVLENNPQKPGTFGAGLGRERSVQVYTKIWRGENGRYFEHQEINDVVIPGSEGDYPADKLPYRHQRWEKVDNEPYGRGLIEQYQGTLDDIEILDKALTEGAVAASRVIPLVEPASVLDPQDLNDAENGEALVGRATDLTFMKVDKLSDFRITKESLDEKVRAMSAVFLLNTARNAERVTAEEIRVFAAELESTHAGVFLTLAVEFQLPIVSRIIDRLTKEGAIGAIKGKLKDHIKPAPLTGVDALARGADLEKIRAVFTAAQNILGPDQFAQYANPGVVLKFMLTSAGLDIPGAIRTEEEVQAMQQQAQQQAQQQQLMQGAVGPLAQGAVDNPQVAEALAEAAQQQ